MKTAIRILIILTGIYMMYHIYNNFYNPYQTQVVYEKAENKSFICEGIAFKDESVLTHNKGENIIYNYDNSVKVASGSLIASMYNSPQDIINVEKISKIDEEITLLNECQRSSDLKSLHIDLLVRQINELQLDYITSIENNDIDKTLKLKPEIIKTLNMNDIKIGNVTNFKKRINELKKQKASLKSEITAPLKIISDKSGYFVNTIDGYEDKYNLAACENLTSSSLKKSLQDFKPNPNSNIIGKVITNPVWRFATLIPNSYVVNLKKGDELKIRFPGIYNDKISVVVESFNFNNKTELNLVVFSVNTMNPKLSSMRKAMAEIIFEENIGLSVPISAERTKNGKKGVYIKTANSIEFKRIIPIFYNDDAGYILCKIKENNKKYLKQYDEVVTKGRDLDDGKIIN